MNSSKDTLQKCNAGGWNPPHTCRLHLIILEETHSVNSSHNIVIARRSKCRICGKIFEESNDRGL